MDYQKWIKEIEETNQKIKNNFADLLETCENIKEIVLTTYGLTSICLTINETYKLYIPYGNPDLQIHDESIYLTDDLDLLDKLEDNDQFYDFVLGWNETKHLYEEQLEEFLNEWFKKK